ncbi:MAG: fibronectin type III domain-containing protein [Verrucomicrobiia bacterium]
MKRIPLIALAAILLNFTTIVKAGIAYGPPPGGWAYIYTGDSASGAPRRQNQPALDGTWRHENGSDEWNGDVRGVANPPKGGVESNNGVLTIEDAETITSGNNNNRKIYFTHYIGQDGVTINNLLDSGVTISFRARLTPPDDKAEITLPNGYGIFSDGKGMFGVRQSSPSSLISFSLVLQTEDSTPTSSLNFQSAGLTFNRLNGDAPSGSGAVNSSSDANLNPIFPVDPTQWHEFWITIQANDATPGNGTHTVTIYVDGSVVGTSFNVTAGVGNDVDTTVTPNWTDYIAMGLNNSATVGAFDVDFYAYKPGVYPPTPLNPPAAPTGITAISGDKEVKLMWLSSIGADGYLVKRADVSGGPYSVIAPVATTNYTDLTVVNGQTYYYVITATNAAGESPNSVEVVGKPSLAVSGVQAVAAQGQVTISWNVFGQALSYSVHRSTTAGGPYTQIATGLTSTQYTDTDVQPGKTYYYVVYAQLQGGGQSGVSNEASATTPPSAPLLSGELYAATTIRVAWVITNQIINGFVVERSPDGVSFSEIATVPANYRGYTNTGLALNTTYYYRVKATNIGGESPYSQVVSVKTPTLGVNVNFATATAPVPPGYLPDSGLVIADRGNGYYYGWNRDISADTRLRNNANSPDLRYDTLTHLMKVNVSDPSQSAYWEIELPPGFYLVHIVAGDPTATDSVFQFNVEGYLTKSYTPVSGAWWGDFKLVVPVTDGMLTINSGPEARNNKINFVDIYATVPELPTISQNPQSASVLENRAVSFNVAITGGTEPIWYQWYFNGAPIEGGTNSTLYIPRPRLTDAGNYYVVITNFAGAITSSIAQLEVLPDTEPPKALSTASLDGATVFVLFDEIVEPTTATDPYNYTIESEGNVYATVEAKIVRDDRLVQLTVDPATPLTGDSYTLTITGIADISAATNTIELEPVVITGKVARLTAMDIGLPGTGGFSATGPTINTDYPGYTYHYSNGVFDVTANGWDIWNTVDGFHYVYKEVSGNFDVVVRVQSMTRPDAWAKAGLMIRPLTNANSRFIAIYATPTTGQNNIAFQWRDSDGSGCGSIHGGSGGPAISPPFPNCWLRLQRDGSLINGYWSTNGIDWMLYTNRDTALYGGAYPDTVLVGMAAASHNQSALTNNVFVEFRDFAITLAPPAVFSIISPEYQNGVFTARVLSVAGKTYTLEYTESLTEPVWSQTGTPVPGTGQEIILTDPNAISALRFYRVKMQ